MVHALHRAECQACGRVGNSGCETVDSKLHYRHFSRTIFISIDRRTTPLCQRWLKHFGLTPVPRLSARFPIFFSIVSRLRTSFGLASAKTFLISAACLRKTGAINSLPFGVSDTTRTRRSSGLSTRLTRPLSNSRSTATLIDPGVRFTFGPIVFTGKGPLFRRASSIRKSVSSSPVSSSPAYRYFAAAWNPFIHISQQCTGSAEFFFITTILMLLCNQWLQQCIYINRLDINKTAKE